MMFQDLFAGIYRKKCAASKEKAPAAAGDNELQVLKAEISGLQLTMTELKRQLENQRNLLVESEKSRQSMVATGLDARLQSLFGSLASPLSQLALQQGLHKSGKKVKAENLFRLLSVLENALSDAGLQRVHACNEIRSFEPSSMTPVRPELSFAPGEKVLVRFPGYVFRETYLCKTLVDKIPEDGSESSH